MVNNAGIAGPIGPAEWLQLEDYKKVSMEINKLSTNASDNTSYTNTIYRLKVKVVFMQKFVYLPETPSQSNAHM